MLCILCVSESNKMLQIFDQDGINLNINNIITKYFWLQPNEKDIKAKSICSSCWSTVESFHTFYKSIEEAHKRLNCIKHDNDESFHEDKFSDLSTSVVKQESYDDTEVFTLETAFKQPNSPVVDNDPNTDTQSSHSDSEVPLINLSARKYSNERDASEGNSDSKSEIHTTSLAQDNDDDNSRSDNEYTVPKAKLDLKNSSTFKEFGKNKLSVREFDSFIKKNIQLVCDVCSKPAVNFFSLQEHCKKMHRTVAFATCCDTQFTSRFSLVHHLKLHQNPDLYKCQKCERVLANKKSYNNHMRSHVTQQQTHKCTKCEKLFSSMSKLRRHLNTHFRQDTDQICDQCGKVYHSKQVLKAHQVREHMGIVKERVQCPKCGVYLGDLATLKFHTKHLHPKTKVVHACHICGKISATAYGLKRHIQYMHTMKRVHKCTICEDKAFKTAQMLRPNADDNNAKAICFSCWKTVESFHKFYQTIEEAHTKLTTCLKLPNEESDIEANHFEVFSDFFTPVVKLESSEDTKIEFPETVEIPSIHPIEALLNDDDDDDQKALNSDSESEVPLLKLSKRTKSVEDAEDDEENSDSESDSDNDASMQDSGHQQNNSESESESDTDSDYSAAKKKAKVKASSTWDGKKRMPCKEFDNFIKQNIKLECNICKKPIENFFCLKEHFKKAHKQNAYVTCCERQWTSRFSLVHHLLLHKNPDLYKCQKCGRVLANKKSFKNHTQSHITQERIHKCPKCVKMFSTVAKLEKHTKTHIKPRIDQICEQCGKVCHSKQSLMAHQKREHLGFVKQRVQCPKCGTYLSDSSTLHTHMKYQHPKVEVLNVCKICGKVSTTGYGLKRHMQYMHSMERVHKCNICEDKAFKTAQRLRVSR